MISNIHWNVVGNRITVNRYNKHLLSPKVEVPLILKALKNIYGENVIDIVKEKFSIKNIKDFEINQMLFNQLVDFRDQEIVNQIVSLKK